MPSISDPFRCGPSSVTRPEETGHRLVDGKWTEDWQPVQKADKDGRFLDLTCTTCRGRETVDMDHILQGHYSIKALNPNGIVPKAPDHVDELLRRRARQLTKAAGEDVVGLAAGEPGVGLGW